MVLLRTLGVSARRARMIRMWLLIAGALVHLFLAFGTNLLTGTLSLSTGTASVIQGVVGFAGVAELVNMLD